MTRGMAADLYGDVPPLKRDTWREFVPGLVVVTLGTLAAGFIADHYGAPLTLMALLLGLSLNFLSSDGRLASGLALASRSLLRWGIVLVGARVTATQIIGLGPVALLCVVAIVAVTIGVGVVAARKFGFDTGFGILAGGSVAICGASAAMALATNARQSADQRSTAHPGSGRHIGDECRGDGALPVAAHALSMSNLSAGFMLGASIHDVAQALVPGTPIRMLQARLLRS